MDRQEIDKQKAWNIYIQGFSSGTSWIGQIGLFTWNLEEYFSIMDQPAFQPKIIFWH